MKKTKGKPSEFDMYVGKRIREVRTFKDLPQEILADHFGLTFQQWQKYETAKNRTPIKVLYELSLLFKMDIRKFLPSEEEFMRMK